MIIHTYLIINALLLRGSAAEWLACWTQAQKGLGSDRSRNNNPARDTATRGVCRSDKWAAVPVAETHRIWTAINSTAP